jgi:undecaprenyl-diphosphatase
MSEILEWDKRLLLWLNGFHTVWLDTVMILITKPGFSVPLYIVMAFLIFKKYKAEGWFILMGAGLAILLSDRLTSGLMKPYFARLRPSHEPGLEGLLHNVDGYKGGLYGFASSHAANTFAVAMLLWLTFKKTYRWIGFIFLWAVIIAYTRIYLGVHYPGDVIVGALIGIGCGWLGFLSSQWLTTRWRRRVVIGRP